MRRHTGTLRRTAMIAAATLVAAQPTPAQPATGPGLQHLLDAELARFPGRAGIWVKHLTLGEEAAVHADDTFNSASVIKLPVLALAFQMADRGERDVDLAREAPRDSPWFLDCGLNWLTSRVCANSTRARLRPCTTPCQ